MFKIDSPLMNFLNKVADILILSVIFMISCIPVFTAGAALSAAYYIGFKLVKNEESYIVKGFFKAFRENFKQATVIWLGALVVCLMLFLDFWIILYSGIEFSQWLKIAVMAVSVIFAIGLVFLFPMQARYRNTVKNTVKNAYFVAFSHLPSAILLIAVYAVPVLIIYFVPSLFLAVFFLGFGCVFYFKSFVLLRVFRRFEPVEADDVQQEDEGGIFAESERMEQEKTAD